jgi:uncharacterized membrane protein
MTVAGTLYEWLVFVHIVAAMAWVGGLATLMALGAQAVRDGGPDGRARFVASLRVVGPRVLFPAMVLVVGIGAWMVLDSEGWNFGQTWIVLGLALFAGAFIVGAAHQSRVGIAAERAVAAGDDDAVARHLARWWWGMAVIVALLVVATWDMVFKPGIGV